MDFLTRHSERLGRIYSDGHGTTDVGRRWGRVFGLVPVEAEIKNEEGDSERTSPENVKNPTETEDPGRGHDLGWDMDPAGTEQEFNRDRRHKKYYGHYPVRGQTVTLAKDVWIRSNDLYAVRNGNEEDGFIRIKRGQAGIVSQVLPGFDRRTKAVQVKFGPNLEAVFAVGRGHADPRKFLRRSQAETTESGVDWTKEVLADDLAELKKMDTNKDWPKKAEKDKAFVVLWADGRGIASFETKAQVRDWVEHDDGSEIIWIRYQEPTHKGKKLRVKRAQADDITPEYRQTVGELRQRFDDETADNIISWADDLVSYQFFAEGEEEQREYQGMLHRAVDDIAHQLYLSGHYEDSDDARIEATDILRKFHVAARRVHRAKPATAQADKYFQQQDVEIQVPAMQVGQFSSSAVPGKIIQVEQPGKYRVQIPAEGTVGGVPTELLVVDETYTQPDAQNYGQIRGPLTSPRMDTGQPGIIT